MARYICCSLKKKLISDNVWHKHTVSMIEKIETALMSHFNSKYINHTIKIFQTKINIIRFAMQYVLELLEHVSHTDIARFEQ